MPPSQMLSSKERWCCLRQCSVPTSHRERGRLVQIAMLPGGVCGALLDRGEPSSAAVNRASEDGGDGTADGILAGCGKSYDCSVDRLVRLSPPDQAVGIMVGTDQSQ